MHQHTHHCTHQHERYFSPGELLSATEKRQAALTLSLGLCALALLLLGILRKLWQPQEPDIANLLFLCAAALVAIPVFQASWHSLRNPNMHGVTDLLIALAMLGAWASGDLLTAALLPIIMILGHVLEERSALGSEAAIASLLELTHTPARLLTKEGQVVEIDSSALEPGALVEVRAGDHIPADGIVLEGNASVDTATITGESVPREVMPGVLVHGGTLSLDGWLKLRITHVGMDSALGQIISLMQHAENVKPPITRLLERYAGQYLLLVVLICALVWLLSQNSATTLAILVAACPCALVLAAPSVTVAGITLAARHGILVRSPAFLDELADLDTLIIDKTGTLTCGQLQLDACLNTEGHQKARCIQLAARLGINSSHPVSQALGRCLKPDSQAIADITITALREVPGMGVIAQTNEGEAILGQPQFLARSGITLPDVPSHDGPVSGLVCNGDFCAWFLLSDQLRPEADIALRELCDLGIDRQILLTGDRDSVAQHIGASLELDQIVAEALPAEKLKYVEEALQEHRHPMVVGDGINDSLALKAGAIGVAFGAASPAMTLHSADIVITGNDLRRLGTAIYIGHRCRAILRGNIMLGLGWTFGLILLAATGLLGSTGAMLAALLHNLGTLLVLANSGRLLRIQDDLPHLE